MSILEVVLVPSWWPDGWPHVTSCYLRLPHVMSARTRISHRATSIKLEMTPPVAAADTCFHFFVWGCILMITVPWWPFLLPGSAGRCVIMVTLELMVLVRPSSPDSFSPAPPVSPWSLLTMLSGVISHHQCAQYLGVHFARYYSDKYYFIALIPPAVTNIVLGSRKHALLGSLILSENNWNADCFSDPSGEWLLAWVLTVTWIFSCDQSRPHGASQGQCLVSSDWPDTHNTDLWLAQGLGVVSVHQPHSGTRWIADNKTDHTDSDWSEWRLCQIILTTNLWLLMSCTNLSDKLWMNSCWLFVLQPPLPPDIPIYICLCGVHCDPSCCLPWCRCFTQCEIITWDKTFVCWCSNPIMTWYRQNPTPVHLLIQNGQ